MWFDPLATTLIDDDWKAFIIAPSDAEHKNLVAVYNEKADQISYITVSATHGPNLLNVPAHVAEWLRKNVDWGVRMFSFPISI